MKPGVIREFWACLKLAAKRSGSSEKWLQRQSKDFFTKEAKLRQYKSRAAFKLVDMDKKFKLFKPGMTVVDLGYAPGAWSQVAVERTKNQGRVFGVDILLTQPPPGVCSIQGNFLSRNVQDELKRLLSNSEHGKTRNAVTAYASQEEADAEDSRKAGDLEESIETVTDQLGYLDLEKKLVSEDEQALKSTNDPTSEDQTTKETDLRQYMVDIVLSDMCDPWPQVSGFWLRSVNDPYVRMQNTSGLPIKDHAASIVSTDRRIVETWGQAAKSEVPKIRAWRTVLIENLANSRICVMPHWSSLLIQ